jgi:hypothetical protein
MACHGEIQARGAPQGLKPALIVGLYAALKRRSSTVPHAFVVFPQPLKPRPSPTHIYRRPTLPTARTVSDVDILLRFH